MRILVVHSSEITLKFPLEAKAVLKWDILTLEAALKRGTKIPFGGALPSIDPRRVNIGSNLIPGIKNYFCYFQSA